MRILVTRHKGYIGTVMVPTLVRDGRAAERIVSALAACVWTELRPGPALPSV